MGSMHLLISAQYVLERGPTTCGDAEADPNLMKLIGATLRKQNGNFYAEYVTELAPRQVLDALEREDFRVISTTGVGQTVVWTLHRPSPNPRARHGRDPAPRDTARASAAV